MSSVRQLPFLDEPRDFVVHHVLIDSAKRAASEPNYAYTAYLGHEGILKNVVSVNLLSCVIPHSDSNVRADSNKIYLREYYHLEKRLRRVTATVAPGYYATLANFRKAVIAALTTAVREPPLDNPLDKPEYNLIYFENSTAQIVMFERNSANENKELVSYNLNQMPVSFSLVMSDDRRSVLYKLGFDTKHPLHTPDDTNIGLYRANFVSERLVDISTTDYVDIDIPELPTAGLKMTTETRRVFARVPTVSNLTRTVHDLTDRNVLRRQFHPMNIEKVTIRLFDQYGQVYENNNADHTMDLEIICLSAPPLMVAPPLVQPLEMSNVIIDDRNPPDKNDKDNIEKVTPKIGGGQLFSSSPFFWGMATSGALVSTYASYKAYKAYRWFQKRPAAPVLQSKSKFMHSSHLGSHQA